MKGTAACDSSNPQATIDIVMPCYEDGQSLEEFLPILDEELASLPVRRRYIVVDDGSRDPVEPYLRRTSVVAPITCIRLPVNAGHQRALLAGMGASDGDFVLTLDSDGQHPASVARAIVDLLLEGNDCVNTKRMRTESVPFLKEFVSKLFYILYRLVTGIRLDRGASDFRGIRGWLRDDLISRSSETVFLRGAIALSNARIVTVEFDAEKRLHGSSRFTATKMFDLAAAGLMLNLRRVLAVCLISGVLALAVSTSYVVYAVGLKLTTGRPAPGWSSLMVVIGLGQFSLLIMSGLVLMTLRASQERQRWAAMRQEYLQVSGSEIES